MMARIVRTLLESYMIEVCLPSGDWVALAFHEFDAEHEAIDWAHAYGLDLQEFIDIRRGQ